MPKWLKRLIAWLTEEVKEPESVLNDMLEDLADMRDDGFSMPTTFRETGSGGRPSYRPPSRPSSPPSSPFKGFGGGRSGGGGASGSF